MDAPTVPPLALRSLEWLLGLVLTIQPYAKAFLKADGSREHPLQELGMFPLTVAVPIQPYAKGFP